MAPHQVSQYFCKNCNKLLKETDTALDDAIIHQVEQEECPNCGSLLEHSLIARKQRNSHTPSPPPQSAALLPAFQTAYDINSRHRLSFGIDSIDRRLTLTEGDRVCIIGDGAHANIFVTRLCVRALMPSRHGGFESPAIVFIDAGNSFAAYQCGKFARQYGLDIRSVLGRIKISRPFTPHQLAGLIIRELPSAVQRVDAEVVVISDLLKMLVQDPQVDEEEARWLLKEILRSIRRRMLAHAAVVLSLHTPPSCYDGMVLPLFKNSIEISKEEDCAGKQLAVVVNTDKQQQSKSRSRLLLPERDLQIVSSAARR
jgi:Rad51